MKTQYGTILKRLRIENGLTQYELSKRLNTSNSVISMFERDLRQPSLEMLELYAKVCHTHVIIIMQEIYGGLPGLSQILSEPTATYSYLSKVDERIVESFKSNRYVYDKMMRNPENIMDLLEEAIRLAERYNKKKY